MADNEENKPRRKRKKAHAAHGHHGGAWKVAFADFMTAMMALFLVLWLVSQADIKLKQAIANYFRSPGVFDTIKGGVLPQGRKMSKVPMLSDVKDDEQTLAGIARDLDEKFSTRPEFSKYKDQVKIEVTDEGLKIQLIDKAERVSFPSGSAELTDEARMILTEIANGLCALPNKINIGGHTDSRPFSSKDGAYTNWELSADRANAARRVLESVCVLPEQIHRIIGYADTELLVPDDPYSPSNRRISITVLRLAMIQKDPSQTPMPAPTPGGASQSAPREARPEPAKSETPKPEATPENNAPDEKPNETDKTNEQQTNEKKLISDGKVVVGEADQIPAKPVIKE